jgi:hypothetical protein
MEVKYTPLIGNKKKLIFYGSEPYSYSKHNISGSRIPVGCIVEDSWSNLQFNIESFTGDEGFVCID